MNTFYSLETRTRNPKTDILGPWERSGLGTWAQEQDAIDAAGRYNALWENSRARVVHYTRAIVWEAGKDGEPEA